MRVLVISHAPQVKIRTRAAELAAALAVRGAEVDLYVRETQTANLSRVQKLRWHARELGRGVARVERAENLFEVQFAAGHRFRWLTEWAERRASGAIRRSSYDVVFTAAYVGVFVPARSAGRVVYDLVDDHADGYRQAGDVQAAERIDQFMHRQIEAADDVTVSGLTLQELAQTKFGRTATYAPNGANVAAVRSAGPPEPGAEWRIGYMGGLDYYVNLKLVVAAVERLRRTGKPVELVVIGDGPALAGWTPPEWVTLCGFRPPAEIPQLMRKFRVGTVPFEVCPLTDAALPLKVIEYGAARMRVVCTPFREVVLQKFPWVDLAAPDPDKWAAALDAALAAPWPEHASEVVDRFDWGATADRLMAVFTNKAPTT